MYATYESQKVAQAQKAGYVRLGLGLWAGVGAVLVVLAVTAPAKTTQFNVQAQTQTATRVAPAAMINNAQRVATGAATATVAAMAQAPAALAEVAPRMNGDGTGLILGVNEPILGWILISVFGLVWALYATSVKGISNNDDEDSGLFL